MHRVYPWGVVGSTDAYDPDCEIAGTSAALLDITSVNHRALFVSGPQPGTWTVGVYGRINIPTAYTGTFETYDKR